MILRFKLSEIQTSVCMVSKTQRSKVQCRLSQCVWFQGHRGQNFNVLSQCVWFQRHRGQKFNVDSNGSDETQIFFRTRKLLCMKEHCDIKIHIYTNNTTGVNGFNSWGSNCKICCDWQSFNTSSLQGERYRLNCTSSYIFIFKLIFFCLTFPLCEFLCFLFQEE